MYVYKEKWAYTADMMVVTQDNVAWSLRQNNGSNWQMTVYWPVNDDSTW